MDANLDRGSVLEAPYIRSAAAAAAPDRNNHSAVDRNNQHQQNHRDGRLSPILQSQSSGMGASASPESKSPRE